MNSPCFEKSKFHKERKVLQIVRDPVIAPLKIHGSNLLPRIPPSTTNGVSQPARTEEAHQTPSLSPCRSLSLSLESVVNNCTTRSGVEVPRVLVCILFRVICLDILIADRGVFLAVQRDRSGFRTTAATRARTAHRGYSRTQRRAHRHVVDPFRGGVKSPRISAIIVVYYHTGKRYLLSWRVRPGKRIDIFVRRVLLVSITHRLASTSIPSRRSLLPPHPSTYSPCTSRTSV